MKNRTKEVQVLFNGTKVVKRYGIRKFLYQNSSTIALITTVILTLAGVLTYHTVKVAGESDPSNQRVEITTQDSPVMIPPSGVIKITEAKVTGSVTEINDIKQDEAITYNKALKTKTAKEEIHTDHIATDINKSEIHTDHIATVTEDGSLPSPRYNPDSNLYILAHVINGEAGAEYCTDDMRRYVGSVVLNRVNSSYFPDNIKDVVFQDGQYACTWDGNYDKEPEEYCWEIAAELLMQGSVLPETVVFQAQFPQGSGTYLIEQNMYFCYQ